MSEQCGKENCIFFLCNIELWSLGSELAACNFRSCGLVSNQELPWGSGVVSPGPLGPARLTAQDDGVGSAPLPALLPPSPPSSPLPLKMMLLHFILCSFGMILGKYPILGIGLSLKVLSFKTWRSQNSLKYVEVDVLYSEKTLCF